MARNGHIVVTGGCGFVGANLVHRLAAAGEEVVVVDDLRTGRREHVEGRCRVVVGDAGDPEVLGPALQGCSAVVHLASETGVAPSVEDPLRDLKGNAVTTVMALEAARRAGVRRFVFSSSGAALGEVEQPLHEGRVPHPLSPYGAGKLAGEAYCQAYSASFGMEAVALRFSNVYGPFSAHKRNNAVPRFVTRALRGEPLEIYGDGSRSRDFIHVDDICSAIERALQTEGIGGEVFQLATGVETTVKELADTVLELTGSTAGIVHRPARPGEVERTSVDVSKAARVLGWRPRISLTEGLCSTIEWFGSARS